ncbi:MAG: hypothetical protein J6128_06995, partial [Clostridia bacterium]|nr:hypothetical protein [Clostridia bacterium]
MAAVVVFVTTYALILPAITIDENAAKDEPGIFLDEDNGSGQTGGPEGNCDDPDRFENPDSNGRGTSDEILSPDPDNADASDGNGSASLLESLIAGGSVSITASVPEGTALSLSEISDEGVSDRAAAVLGKDLESCYVIGLNFVDTEGNDVETDGPAYITVVHDYLSSDGAQLLQLDETGSVSAVASVSRAGSTASFSASMPLRFVIARPEQDTEGEEAGDPGSKGNQKTDFDEVLSDGGMPEQVFKKEINCLTVDVHAPWGTFPDGTVMVLTNVDEEEIISSIRAAVENESARSRVTQVKAVDISFIDADGNEIEPENPIRVSMRDELIASSDYQNVLDVVHVDDEGMVSFVPQTDDETGKDEVAFDSEEFSVYAIVKSEITVRYLTAEGESYIITVTHGPDAGIPDGAELEVTEILRGRDSTGGAFGFDTYLSMTQDALGLKSSSFAGVRLFDISIVMDGRKIEIASPVEVKIQLDGEKAGLDTFVVHFADGAENGDLVRGVEVDCGEISFEAEGFSAYAIVYVDSPESLSSAWHKITTVGELAEFSSAGTGLYVGHVDGYYFMNTLTADSKRSGITKTGLSPYYPHPDAALYYFEKKEGTEDQFYAYCTRLAEDGVTEIRQYVKNKNSNSLFFTDSRDDATAFTASADSDGKFQISYPTTGNTWYWNMQGGANGKRFCSYNQLDDPNNYLYFWYYIPPTDDPFELDGKTFGLMNWNGGVAGKAMMT